MGQKIFNSSFIHSETSTFCSAHRDDLNLDLIKLAATNRITLWLIDSDEEEYSPYSQDGKNPKRDALDHTKKVVVGDLLVSYSFVSLACSVNDLRKTWTLFITNVMNSKSEFKQGVVPRVEMVTGIRD